MTACGGGPYPDEGGGGPRRWPSGKENFYELYTRLGNCRFDRGRALALSAVGCSTSSPGAESA